MIEFQELYKAFDEKPVLQGLSLKIRDAETVVIIGYSGTGKRRLSAERKRQQANPFLRHPQFCRESVEF